MFLHLSVSHFVHRGEEYLIGNPQADTPPTPLGRYTPKQVHPLGRYTPRQVHPQQVHPLGRYTPLGKYTPDCSACWDTVNKRAVRIPLECILIENIRKIMMHKTL